MNTEIETIDQFIASFPVSTQKILKELRQKIKESAPQAQEKISYGIATFTLRGNLVHFSAYKNHIGFYPGTGGIEAFKDKLSGYETSKGTVKFPIDKPLPYNLIQEIVKYRAAQNLAKN